MRNKLQAEMTANPSKYPQGYFKDKPCKYCGKVFKPQAPSHLHCSQDCADASLTDNYLRRNYGVGLEWHNKQAEKQKHVCAICNQVGFKMKKEHNLTLVVDHCHKTNTVRGLLCHNCNRALGLFKDNTEYLNNAIAYLEGATTIPEGSTPQAIGGGSARPL
jgi:hypothetical protein